MRKLFWSYTCQTDSLQFTDKPFNAANQDKFMRYQFLKNNFFIKNNAQYNFSATFLIPFFISPEIETHFSWWERCSKTERVWRLIMKEAIQIIQMLAMPPPPLPPGSEGSFLSLESDVSMAHWKQPPCAQRWMPRLSTMAPIWIPRGYMPDRSPNKRKRATLLSFNHVVILLES